MKTAAIISTATIAGSIAFAAGQQTGTKQPPVMPSGSQMHTMQEGMPQARMAQMGGGCAPEPWFATTLHPISGEGCGVLDHLPLQNVDVNGDGTNDLCYPRGLFSDFGGTLGVVATTETGAIESRSTTDFLQVTRFEQSPSGLVFTTNGVLPDLSAALAAKIPEVGNWNPAECSGYHYYITFEPLGWLDCDSDGDLDLIVNWNLWRREYDPSLPCMPVVGAAISGQYAWLENIGYEKPAPPLAADLNQDGQVDGADLGLLLVAWGPNP
jgi:hypothetical protein